MNSTSQNPNCHEICFVDEIISGSYSDGRLVRVTGKLHSYDPIVPAAQIYDPNERNPQEYLEVALLNIEQHAFVCGSLYQFIGEVTKRDDKFSVRATAARNVDNLDILMLKQTVKLMRKFLADRKSKE